MQLLNFKVGLNQPFFLISGPCVIESESLVLQIAEEMKKITEELNINYIFKASFDKANRSSSSSYRGLGLEKGLKILAKVKESLDIPILTDVHEDSPIDEIASVVDVMQTPAFLVRQTNFIQKVCKAGIPVNIKKGQFQAPWDMEQVVKKAKEVNNDKVLVCERGVSFGYNNLVVDMRSLVIMRNSAPVVFDATHSVQQPGGLGASSGGQKEFVPPLARAAAAVGVSGFFMETHPNPDAALSDGPNMIPLKHMGKILKTLKEIDTVTKANGFLEDLMQKK